MAITTSAQTFSRHEESAESKAMEMLCPFHLRTWNVTDRLQTVPRQFPATDSLFARWPAWRADFSPGEARPVRSPRNQPPLEIARAARIPKAFTLIRPSGMCHLNSQITFSGGLSNQRNFSRSEMGATVRPPPSPEGFPIRPLQTSRLWNTRRFRVLRAT